MILSFIWFIRGVFASYRILDGAFKSPSFMVTAGVAFATPSVISQDLVKSDYWTNYHITKNVLYLFMRGVAPSSVILSPKLLPLWRKLGQLHSIAQLICDVF